jgi:tape measure domain-containing protein
MILPTTAALNNLAKAADAVKGSTGGTVALNNLAKAAQAVSTATGGSATAMNSFARAAAAIGSSTQSGTALNAFAKAAAAVTTATGSPQTLTRFADAATKVAQAGTPAGVIAFSKAIESLAPAAATGAAGLKAIEAAAASAKTAFTATAGAGGALAGAGLTTGAANAATGQLTAMGAAAAGAAGGVVDLAFSETDATQEALGLLRGLMGAATGADTADQAADDLSTGLDVTGDAMDDASRASQGLSTNTVSLADALRQLASLLTVLLNLPTALGNIATAAGSVGQGLADVSAAVNASGGPTGAFVQTLSTIDQALTDTNLGLDRMESAFNEWAVAAGVTTALSSTLVGGFDAVGDQVDELTAKLRELLQAFQTLADFQREQGNQGGEGGIGGLGATLPTPPQPPTGSGGGGSAANPDYAGAIDEVERLLGLTEDLGNRLDDLGPSAEAAVSPLSEMDVESVRDAVQAYGDLSDEFDRLARQRYEDLGSISPEAELQAGRLVDYLNAIGTENKEVLIGLEQLNNALLALDVGPLTYETLRGSVDYLMEQGLKLEEAMEVSRRALLEGFQIKPEGLDAAAVAVDYLQQKAQAAELTMADLNAAFALLGKETSADEGAAAVARLEAAYQRLQAAGDDLGATPAGKELLAFADAASAEFAALDQTIEGLGATGNEALGAIGGMFESFSDAASQFNGMMSEASIQARALMLQLQNLEMFGGVSTSETFPLLDQLQAIARAGDVDTATMARLTKQVEDLTMASQEGPGSLMPANFDLSGAPIESWAKMAEGIEKTKAKGQQLLDILNGVNELQNEIGAIPPAIIPPGLKEAVEQYAQLGTGDVPIERLGAQIDILGQRAEIMRVEMGLAGQGVGSFADYIEGLIDRLDNLGAGSERAYLTIQELIETLRTAQNLAGGGKLQPFDITDVKAAEAALVELEAATKRGAITNADVQAARAVFQAVRDGAADATASVEDTTLAELAFSVAADAAGKKADVFMMNLKALEAAGKLAANEFDALYEALAPWVEVQMGEGFAVPDFSSVELEPLLEINKILERIVETGKASAEQIAAVQAQAAKSTDLSRANLAASQYATLPTEYGGLGEGFNRTVDQAEQVAQAYDQIGEAGQAAFDIVAQASEVAATAGEQSATGFERMLQIVDEIGQSGTVMMTMGNYVNTLKASLESWSTTGTGPISVDEMTRQVAVMVAYKEGLISAGDAVNRLANESTPAFDVLTAAEQAAGDAAAEAALNLRSLGDANEVLPILQALQARLEALRDAVAAPGGPVSPANVDVGALDKLNSLYEMLKSVGREAEDSQARMREFGAISAEMRPFNASLITGASAAIDVFEEAIRRGSLTTRDAIDALREFQLAGMATEVELKSFGASATRSAEDVQNFISEVAAYGAARLTTFTGATPAAQDSLRGMLEELVQVRLTAQSIDDVRLSSFISSLEVLSLRAQDGKVSVNDVKEAIAFYEDMADRAEVITGSLGGQMQRVAVDADLLAEAARKAGQGFIEMDRPTAGTTNLAYMEALQAALAGLTPATGQAAVNLQALTLSANAYTDAAARSGGVISDEAGQMDALSSIVRYLLENLKEGKVTTDAISQAFDIFVAKGDEASSTIARTAESLHDLNYGEAVFGTLVDRIENFVGASSEAQSGLNILRDALIEITNLTGMGRTLDPNAVKAFTMAIETLEAAQRQGVVSAEDVSRALAAQQAIMDATGGATQGLAAAQNALSQTAQDAQGYLEGLEGVVRELQIEPNDLIASGTLEDAQAITEQIMWLRDALAPIARGEFTPSATGMQWLEDQLIALSDLAMGDATLSETLEKLSRDFSETASSGAGFADVLNDLADRTVALPSFEESAAAAADLGNAIEAAGGKSAYIDQLINRVRALSGSTEEVNALLEDMQNAIRSQEFAIGVTPDADADLAGLVAGLEELEARAEYGVVSMKAMDAAFVQAAEASERFTTSLEGVTPTERKVAEQAQALLDVLYGIEPAGKRAALALSDLMQTLESIAGHNLEGRSQGGIVDWLMQYGASIDEAVAASSQLAEIDPSNMNAMGDAVEAFFTAVGSGKATVEQIDQVWADFFANTIQDMQATVTAADEMAVSVALLVDELRQLVSTGQMDANVAQPMIDGLNEMRGTLSTVDQEFTAWVQKEIAEAKQLGAGLSESQMDAAQTAQFLGSSLETLTGKTDPAIRALMELTAVLREWTATGTGDLSKMADLFAILEQIGATGPAMLPEGVGAKVISEADTEALQGFLNSLTQVSTAADQTNSALAEVERLTSASGSAAEKMANQIADLADRLMALVSADDLLASLANRDLDTPARALGVMADEIRQVSEEIRTGEGSYDQYITEINAFTQAIEMMEAAAAKGPLTLASMADAMAVMDAAASKDMMLHEEAKGLSAVAQQWADSVPELAAAGSEAEAILRRLQAAFADFAAGKGTWEQFRQLRELTVQMETLPGHVGSEAAVELPFTAVELGPIKAYLDSLDQLAPAAIESAQALQAEATAADETSRALHGAAKAAHEAKVARDALAASGGGGAGVPPTPPAPPTGPTPPDDLGPMYQRLADLMAQLAAVRAAAASAAVPLAAVGAAGGVAGAGAAAAGAAAAGAVPPLARSAGAAAGAAAALGAAGAAGGGAAPPINNAANAAGNAANNFGRIPPAANAAAASMNNVAHSAGNASDRASFLNRTLSMAFAFSGGVAVTNVIGFITNALVGFNSTLEQTRIAFATFMGSGNLADAFIKKMQAFADITPFEFTGLKDSVQRLMAMGFAAESTLVVLQAVGDAVAATGGNAEKLDRITVALGQMYTAGKVNAQDMRQLTEAMVPAWKMLADEMGVSVAEARKAVTAGLVPASEGINAILRGMEKSVEEGGFGGMMAKQARTAAGALSTLHDVALRTISGAVEPLFNAIANGMVALADFLVTGGTKYVLPAIYAMGVAIGMVAIPKIWGMIASLGAATITLGGMSAAEIAAGQAAYAAAGGVGTLAVAVGGLTIPILPLIIAVTAFGIAWQENIGGMRDVLEPVLRGIGNTLAGFGKFLADLGVSAAFLTTAVIALAVAISTKLVASLTLALAATIKSAVVTPLLSLIYVGLGVSASAAATGVTGLSGALTALLALMGGVVAVVAAVAFAISLVLLNFDDFNQGIRYAEYGLLGLIQRFFELSATIPFVGEWAKGAAQAVSDMRVAILGEMDKNAVELAAKRKKIEEDSAKGITPGFDLGGWDTKMDDFMKEMESKLSGGSEALAGATQSLIEQFGATLNGVLTAAREAGGAAMLEMASGIQSLQDAPLNALKELRQSLKTQLSPMSEVALLYGELTSKELAKGLASNNPGIKAKAIAIQKLIMERLAMLPPNAALAGLYTSGALADGLVNPKAIAALKSALSVIGGLVGGFFDRLTGGLFGRLAGQLKASLGAAKDFGTMTAWMNDQLAATDELADSAAGSLKDMADEEYALGEAWKTIEDTAKHYFDFIHEKNLKAIQDVHDLADAQLDAAEIAARKPAKEMSASYDAMKDARKLAELQKAVADAQAGGDQKALFEAQQNLTDFQTEQEITRLTDIGEGQVTALEAQRKMNEDLLKQQQDAENLRYESQTEAFAKELAALQSYLDRHPEAWATVHAKVIKLLHKFGIDYKAVGSTLGKKFAEGLDDAVDVVKIAGAALGAAAAAAIAAGAAKDAKKNAKTEPPPVIPEPPVKAPTLPKLPEPIPFPPPPAGSVSTGPRVPQLASGMWDVPFDNLLANLHAEEMVVPAGPARQLRDLLAGGGSGSGSAWQTAASTGGGGAGTVGALGEGNGGSGTLIIQLDGRVIASVVDQRIAIREDLVTVQAPGVSQW